MTTSSKKVDVEELIAIDRLETPTEESEISTDSLETPNEEQNMSADTEVQSLVPVQIDSQPTASILAVPFWLPNNRPVDPSNISVSSSLTPRGNRPVMTSNLQVFDTYKASGSRPIASSHLHIDQTLSIMGNRPIASNEMENADVLMGYLD